MDTLKPKAKETIPKVRQATFFFGEFEMKVERGFKFVYKVNRFNS